MLPVHLRKLGIPLAGPLQQKENSAPVPPRRPGRGRCCKRGATPRPLQTVLHRMVNGCKADGEGGAPNAQIIEGSIYPQRLCA